MSFIITNFSQFDAFKNFCKDNPDVNVVYMWCKNYYKVYYVGVSRVKGTKKTRYLTSHHTLPSLHIIFNKGDKLIIYLKYDERSIVSFFRPKLNKIGGQTIGGHRSIPTRPLPYSSPQIDSDPYERRIISYYSHIRFLEEIGLDKKLNLFLRN
tara:strand:- start:333 stop:791 length:459 start_codon:yes stop_codon:yes gene_type:complete